MLNQLRPAAVTLVAMAALTGLAYPLTMTSVAQAIFPHQAAGSLVERNGKVIGSELIGQAFDSDRYFHGRPSAAGNGYDAANSSGSNLGPANPKLIERIRADAEKLKNDNPSAPVPMDLVTTSGSGLDPHLSPAAARWQIARVAAARGLPANSLERLVEQHTERPLVGPAVVNVLALNLALADNRAPIRHENTP